LKKVLDSVVEYRLYTGFVGNKPAINLIEKRNNRNEKHKSDRVRKHRSFIVDHRFAVRGHLYMLHLLGRGVCLRFELQMLQLCRLPVWLIASWKLLLNSAINLLGMIA